jgi:hypothetical protein
MQKITPQNARMEKVQLNTIIPADCRHIACLITQASYWIMTHTGTLKLNAFLGASSLARSCYTKKATDTSVMRDPTNLGDIPKRFRHFQLHSSTEKA